VAVSTVSNRRSFYRDRFGFTLIAQYGKDHAVLRRDAVALNFWPCRERHVGKNTSAYFNVEDVDGLYAGRSPRHSTTGCASSTCGTRTGISCASARRSASSECRVARTAGKKATCPVRLTADRRLPFPGRVARWRLPHGVRVVPWRALRTAA